MPHARKISLKRVNRRWVEALAVRAKRGARLKQKPGKPGFGLALPPDEGTGCEKFQRAETIHPPPMKEETCPDDVTRMVCPG